MMKNNRLLSIHLSLSQERICCDDYNIALTQCIVTIHVYTYVFLIIVENNNMRIVQISDLHIGGLFKQDAFDTMVEEINNDLKPDVIIVSGDLTDDGLIFQFEQAKNEIKKTQV